MKEIDISYYIVPTPVKNYNGSKSLFSKPFITSDLVYLISEEELKNICIFNKVVMPTDYAVLSGVDPLEKSYWLRSCCNEKNKVQITNGISVENVSLDDIFNGIRPAMRLNAQKINEAQRLAGCFPISGSFFSNPKGEIHYLEFGTFPKSSVAKSLQEELEREFSLQQSGCGQLRATGKKYIFSYDDVPTQKFDFSYEYQYKGLKYVRTLVKYDKVNIFYSAGNSLDDDEVRWVKVEPIKWQILNWSKLPTYINPEGDGSDDFISVVSSDILMSAIPFYPNCKDNYSNLWQNSMLRGYLNGINVSNITTNGNTKLTAPAGGDFTGQGFLREAFVNSIEEIETETNVTNVKPELTTEISKKISRLTRLNPDTTPVEQRRNMTDTEIIKSWVDAGQSVLLRGPSGIGKTERLKTLYPNLIYIKLTNNMFPEKVVGSVNLQTGQVIPPDFAKEALLSVANEQEREQINADIQNLFKLSEEIYERSKTSTEPVVILLDELLNVKPAIQSLVYTLVLNKIVETGKGLKLPANTVVVATGNQKKYSVAAEDLAEPLEKRFDHVLDMRPKVNEWIYEYAIPQKIHPAVIGYIFSKYLKNGKREDINEIGYFYEEPEVGELKLDENGCKGKTNDPRSWTSISKMLYNFESELQSGKFEGMNVENALKVSLHSKLRSEWAEEFFDFYNNPTLTVEEVVKNRYTEIDLPQNINERFAQLSVLLSANEKEVRAVRQFIREHCDPEYLEVYDMYWAGSDVNRIELIVELREEDSVEEMKDVTNLK